MSGGANCRAEETAMLKVQSASMGVKIPSSGANPRSYEGLWLRTPAFIDDAVGVWGFNPD